MMKNNSKFKIQNSKLFLSAKSFIGHPLFTGSAVMVVGSNFANFIAYVYHLIFGRILGPSAYGELAATLAALGLFSTTFYFFGVVITKFVSAGSPEERTALYSWFFKKGIYIDLCLLGLMLAFSSLISSFLHIQIKIAFLIGPILFFFLLAFLFRSFLQGLLKFGQSVAVSISDLAGRLFFGLIFIWLGLSTFGAVLGILTGSFLSFLLGYLFLREFRQKKVNYKPFEIGKRVLRYAWPVFIISFANNSFISSDILLAKHYFSSYEAGIYASMSTLGKIIFYGTAPIVAVMFPLISQKAARGQSYAKILFLSLAMTVVVGFAILLVYILFPNLMVKILFGSRFIEAAKNLAWFGLFMFVYTITGVFISFYLSLDKTKVAVFPVVFALVQIVGILLYHDSILSLIKVSTLAATLLLVSLLIYFGYGRKENLNQAG